MSRSFDRYWNNVRAYPVQSLINEPDLLKLKTQFDQEDAKTEAAPAPDTGIAEPGPGNRVREPEPDPLDLGPGHGAGGQPDQDPRRRCGAIGRQRASRSGSVQDDDAYSPPPRPRRR